MKLSLIQTDVVWNDVKQNQHNIEKLLESQNLISDIYFLPEMWNTGFNIELFKLKDVFESSVEWMRTMCFRYNFYLGGSLHCYENNQHFNRFVVVNPKGNVVGEYDKRHLFALGSEHENFTAGNNRIIVNCLGTRILLQICYDLRFPVFSRNLGDYDLIIYVANWPINRRLAWDTLLRARAIENQCFVAGVNRVGNDPNAFYNGGSKIIAPNGCDLISAVNSQSEIITADINLDMLKKYQTKFPVLDDADYVLIDFSKL